MNLALLPSSATSRSNSSASSSTKLAPSRETSKTDFLRAIAKSSPMEGDSLFKLTVFIVASMVSEKPPLLKLTADQAKDA